MKSKNVTLPQLGMIAATRAALGAGIALLVGERLCRKPRRKVGWALVALGALTTFPLLSGVLTKGEGREMKTEPQPAT